jgi:hypothetical protein
MNLLAAGIEPAPRVKIGRGSCVMPSTSRLKASLLRAADADGDMVHI